MHSCAHHIAHITFIHIVGGCNERWKIPLGASQNVTLWIEVDLLQRNVWNNGKTLSSFWPTGNLYIYRHAL